MSRTPAALRSIPLPIAVLFVLVASDPAAARDWTAALVDATGDVGDWTAIAIGADGVLHVTCNSATNHLQHAWNSGGTWQIEEVDGWPNSGSASSPLIAPNGDLHVSYNSGGRLNYAVKSGGTWSLETIDPVGLWNSSLVLDSNGHSHIGYATSFTADVRYATNTTGSWVVTVIDSSAGSDLTLALDANENIHIAYYGWDAGLVYATDAGGSWAFTVVDSTEGAGRGASMAIDSAGDVHVTYDNGGFHFGHATMSGGVWTLDEILDLWGSSTVLAIGPDDDLHVVGFYPSAPLKYARRRGDSWNVEHLDGQEALSLPSMALDSLGNMQFAVHEYVEGDLLHVVGREWTEDGGPIADPGAGTGAAWGDADGDGDLDLYLGNNGPNRFFRNDDGVFEDATSGPLGDGSVTTGVAWGDYDNDEDLDLYLGNGGQPNKLLRNDGGNFADVTSGPLADGGSAQGVAWVDHDNDGDLDVYVINIGAANSMLRNDGVAGFSNVTGTELGDTGTGLGVAWADFDDDGDQDVYLPKSGGPNRLLRNDGGGAFVDVTSAPLGDAGGGTGAAWGDFDNDLDLDLYLTNFNGPNVLFRNDGAGGFVDVTPAELVLTGASTTPAWGDFDNDGWLDLYVADATGGAGGKLFHNRGGGEFVENAGWLLGGNGGTIAAIWGDTDRDGDLDLYLSDNVGANSLVENHATGAFHWLQVELIGRTSNASGIGARVLIAIGPEQQMREISGGSGYLSQGSLIAHFGLGPGFSSWVSSVEVRWPSGTVQTLGPMPGDQRIVFDEDWEVGSPAVAPGLAGSGVRLHQNAPNPFVATTAISFELPVAYAVSLAVYDVSGRRVRSLVSGAGAWPAGRHVVRWEGRDDQGRRVGSGVYFYRLEAGGAHEKRRMTVLR